MATITNQKTGETLESSLSPQDACNLFAKHYADKPSKDRPELFFQCNA